MVGEDKQINRDSNSRVEGNNFVNHFEKETGMNLYDSQHHSQHIGGGWIGNMNSWRNKLLHRDFLPVIDPWDNSYYVYLTISSVAVFYNVCCLIPRVTFSFLEQGNFMKFWYVFDYLADAVYIIDMVSESRTGFLEDGILVEDNSKLRRKYFDSITFKLHILSVLPSDIFYYVLHFPLAALRLNRLLRFPRLIEFLDRGWKISDYPNIWRFCTLIFYLTLFLHYNACVYYEISKIIGFNQDNWVVNDTLYGTYLGKYSYCFWWACERVTMGDIPAADSNVELIFVIVNIMFAILIFATLYGNIGEILTQLTAKMEQFHQWSASIRLFMNKHRIPKQLQNKVVRWMEHYWNENRSISGNEDAALRILPEKLRAEINMNAHLDTLRRVRIFQDCEPGLLVALVNKLKLVLFNPGEYVCVKGEVGKEMYIVKRGVLSVVSPDGTKVYSRLGAGAVLGELSLLNISGTKTGNRRTASVKSNGYSDLFCLTKEDLWAALKDFPDARRVFVQKGKEILKKDGLLQDDCVNENVHDLSAEDRSKLLEHKITTLSNSMGIIVLGWATHLHQTLKRVKNIENEIRKYEMQGVIYREKREQRKREKKWREIDFETERTLSDLSNFSSTCSLKFDAK